MDKVKVFRSLDGPVHKRFPPLPNSTLLPLQQNYTFHSEGLGKCIDLLRVSATHPRSAAKASYESCLRGLEFADLCDFGFMAAREQGLRPDTEIIARTTWTLIENTSIRPMKDGKLCRNEREALTYLREAAERLLAEKIGLLKTLGM